MKSEIFPVVDKDRGTYLATNPGDFMLARVPALRMTQVKLRFADEDVGQCRVSRPDVLSALTQPTLHKCDIHEVEIWWK